MLTLTAPGQIWAHRLPAGGKMAALALWTALLFQLPMPALTLAAMTTTALTLSGGMTFAAVSGRMLRPLWPFVVIVTLWHLWQGNPATGALIVLRMVTAVAAANFVTMTTSLTAMIAVITWAARPLRHLGLNPATLALAVALVIRFVPVLLIKSQTIALAFRARSVRRPGWRLMVPVLLAALDDAETISQALRARGGTG